MAYTINAPAKINLGLDVIRRREDGYHDLKMIMQTVNLFDTLTFNIATHTGLQLTCNNKKLPNGDHNLIIKVIHQLFNEFAIETGLDITLEKRIPVAAGMAGGSADAAATYVAINDLFGLGLSREDLMKRAVLLGADIPYCILQGTALAEGIGDVLTPVAPPENCHVLLVKPPIHVSTKFVYTNLIIDSNTIHPDIDYVLSCMTTHKHAEFHRALGNVLESVTIPAHPIIQTIKNIMIENGADSALMSGSGPTVFGLFSSLDSAKKAQIACAEHTEPMLNIITDFLFTQDINNKNASNNTPQGSK